MGPSISFLAIPVNCRVRVMLWLANRASTADFYLLGTLHDSAAGGTGVLAEYDHPFVFRAITKRGY